MSEMVERVAIALARHNGCVVTQQFVGKEGGLTNTVEVWREWIPYARAAIESMREPTKEMLNAGMEVGGLCDREIEFTYQAMIDRALG